MTRTTITLSAILLIATVQITLAQSSREQSKEKKNASEQVNGEKARISINDSIPWRSVNYDSIAQAVGNPASPYYYPTLFERYKSGDTTLSVEDFRHLYYGYPTQEGYKPLINSLYSDSLYFSFGRRTNPTPDEFRRMARYANGILYQEPFSMRDLNVLAFIYQKLGEDSLATQQMFRIEGIMSAIRSSGTGFTQRAALYIIYMRDAEDFLTLIGAQANKAVVVNRKIEYYPVSNLPDRGMKGLFFNYSEVYRRIPDYIEPTKVKRKFEINPMYNPKSKSNVLPY